jgi:predicted nucleic acid-binding protein
MLPLRLSWCFQDENTEYSRSVLTMLRRNYAVVPALWVFEVANVLILAERRGRITTDLRRSFLRVSAGSLYGLSPVQFSNWQGIFPLAEKYRLTGYDAAYLELAQRSGLPLATLDGDLRKAALAEGVALVDTP